MIIPVYRGRRETLACIDSVLATADANARIIVVDDATDDRELAAELDALAVTGCITLSAMTATRASCVRLTARWHFTLRTTP